MEQSILPTFETKHPTDLYNLLCKLKIFLKSLYILRVEMTPTILISNLQPIIPDDTGTFHLDFSGITLGNLNDWSPEQKTFIVITLHIRRYLGLSKI